ncbi:hypothetical protein ACFQT0_04560 [Hymenobacter humi]|uniref:Uncharacterized protein n=1 Tax=Hymenobacter humi TaxID=1411620 RepID=A0ABW2U2V9_9BACT
MDLTYEAKYHQARRRTLVVCQPARRGIRPDCRAQPAGLGGDSGNWLLGWPAAAAPTGGRLHRPHGHRRKRAGN